MALLLRVRPSLCSAERMWLRIFPLLVDSHIPRRMRGMGHQKPRTYCGHLARSWSLLGYSVPYQTQLDDISGLAEVPDPKPYHL